MEVGAGSVVRAWLGADQRWTVSHKATSIAAACAGHGFSWHPEATIRRELEAGVLKPLPIRGQRERLVTMSLVIADPEYAGPATRELAGQILRAASV